MEFCLLHLPCSQAAQRKHGPPSKLYTANCPLSLRSKTKGDPPESTSLTSQTSTFPRLKWNPENQPLNWSLLPKKNIILQVPILKFCSISKHLGFSFCFQSHPVGTKRFHQVTPQRMQQSRVWQHLRQHHSASIDLEAHRCNR